MSKTTSKYTDYSIHQMFIDAIKEDGAKCDATTKEYDERATQTRGVGAREAFTHYNNRINLYQTALKVIKGEYRANIYEAIPVIDYATPENTGLENVYEVDENGNVDPRYITKIPLEVEDTALSLLLENDPYTINRALLGQETAEHFYNTAGLTGSEYNLQTDPILESKYLYKGVRSKVYSTANLTTITSYRTVPISAVQDTSEERTVLHVNPLDETIGVLSTDGFYYDDYNRDNLTDPVKVILPKILSRPYEDYWIYRDEISEAGKRNFITQSSSDANYIDISLDSGDICIYIPSATSSNNRDRLLILKQSLVSSTDSTIDGDYIQKYTPFVVYFSDFSATITLRDVEPENDLPSFLKGKAVLSQLEKYIGVEKIYTSKASGLLNGLFCEPYKFEDGYENRVVTEWKYKDDTDLAKNVNIKPGTRYFSGHLLGRGSFIPSPLQLTSKDKKTDKNNVPYKGKATLIYDILNSEDTRTNLLRPVMLEDWSETSNILTLSGLYTKASYSEAKLSKEEQIDLLGTSSGEDSILKNSINSNYSKKLTIDGKPANFDELNAMISGLSEMLSPYGEGYVLSIDLTNAALPESATCYYRSVKGIAATKHFFGLIKKDASSITEVFDNTGEMKDNIHKLIAVSYRDDYNQDGSVNNLLSVCDVQTLNPIEIFRSDFNSGPRTILVYPEYSKQYPTELLLMSNSNLGLEAYDDTNINYKRKSMVSFFYEPEGKILSFKVGRVRKLEFSKIKKVQVKTLETGGYKDVTDTASFDWKEAVTTTITKRVFLFFKKTVTKTEYISNPVNDCYIYTLEPLEISLEGVEICDQNDNYIGLKKTLNNSSIQLLPAAYPASYFSITTQYTDDGAPTYLLNAQHRYSDVLRLSQSKLVIGIPKVNSLKELRTTNKISSISLKNTLANIFDSSDSQGTGNKMSSFLTRALYNILSEWRLTDLSTDNPILLRDFPLVLEGLVEFEGPLKQFSQIQVVEEGETAEAIQDDEGNVFNARELRDFLRNRFESNQKDLLYKLEVPKMNENDWPVITETDPVCSNLAEYIKNRFNKNDIRIDVLRDTTVKKNASIKQANAMFRALKEPSEVISRETCQTIDEYFGNNTTPFLKIIENPDISYVSSILGEAGELLRENIKKIIYKVTKNYVDILNNPVIATIQNTIKNAYSNYYTTPSITFTTGTSDVIVNNLLYNFNASSTRSYISSIISSLGLTKEETYTKNHKFLWWEWTTTHNRTVALTVDDAINIYKLNNCGPFREETNTSSLNLNSSQLSIRKTIISRLYETISRDLEPLVQRIVENSAARYVSPTEKQVDDYLKGIISPLDPKDFYTGLLYEGNGTVKETGEVVIRAYCRVDRAGSQFRWYKECLEESATQEEWQRYIDHDPEIPENVVYDRRGSSEKDYLYFKYTFTKQSEDFSYSKTEIRNELGNIVIAVPEFSESIVDIPESVKLIITLVLPEYNPFIGRFTAKYKLDIEGSSEGITEVQDTQNRYCSKTFNMDVDLINYDISEGTLKSIVNFAEKTLFGTDTIDSETTAPYPIKFVSGDSGVTGRTTSLYYKRYNELNARMNRLKGPLARAASFLRHKKIFEDSKKFDEDFVSNYDQFLTVLPIAKIEPLTFMRAQKATATTIELESKFYNSKELEALRSQISSQCVLTCTRCSVKDSCPFYDENEITKLYCTPADTLSFWVKDNELDLLYYSKEDPTTGATASPNVWRYSSDGKTKEETLILEDKDNHYRGLQDIHKPYSEILAKHISKEKSENYNVRNLGALKEEIERQSYAKDDFKGKLGWLTGARYGTIEKNGVRNFENDAYDKTSLSEYRYLYDALYIPDEETHVIYAPSEKEYPVEFYRQEGAEKVYYKGTTKIKVPVALDVLLKADATDDVYLVADDKADNEGNPITPIVYIDKVGNLKWSFDFEEASNLSVKSEDDPKIYATDVAQWCINYYKGACIENPIGDNSETDYYQDRDQYWMETLYKRIPAGEVDSSVDSYLAIPGRPRISANYQEPLIELDGFNEYDAISGKPVVANYVNFIRKVSLKMFDKETEQWCFKWIKNAENYSKEEIENRKAALPFMKTNLRLVVVRNYDN